MINYALILDRRNLRHLAPTTNGDSYEGIVWTGEPIPKAELDALWPEVQAELHAERVQRERQAAYRAESDPIAMKMLRGEATEAEWLAKVNEIKQRLPDPDGDDHD
jgi:hypothetical protein